MTNIILKKFAKELYLDKVFPAIREEKAQQFITVMLTLITIILFSIFAINPTIVTIVNLNKQLSDSHLVYTQLQTKINNLSILQIKYNDIQDDIPLVFEVLPNSPQTSQVLSKIQAIAISQHLAIIRMETASPLAPLAKTVQVAPFAFSLVLQGTQNDLFTFMHRFSNFDRMVTIDKVLITTPNTTTQPSATQQTTVVQLSIDGKAYYKID